MSSVLTLWCLCLPSAALAQAVSPQVERAHENAERAEPAQRPRLIVRGDDMGFSHSGNEAILKCFTDGIETSIEVIVPSPWFPEAVRMLAEHSEADVGIHLALSSEWDNVKWRPVSDCPSLTDDNGYFYPMIFPNKNYPQQSLSEQDWRLDEIERELRAQIELGLRKIPRTSHVSAHMGCTNLREDVRHLARKLAKEYGIDVDLEEHGVLPLRYTGPSATPDEKRDSFMQALAGLEDGKTYLFVDHPGLDTPELRAIHHVGYEHVAVDRQGVTDAWTDPRVRAMIESRGIQLIGYRDLPE